MDEIVSLILREFEDKGQSQYESVINFIFEKKMSLLMWPHIIKNITDNDIVNLYKNEYQSRTEEVFLQKKELINISTILKENGIDFMIAKGMVLSQILFGNSFSRECSDIDIIVKKEDMLKAYQQLYMSGYRFLESDDDNGNLIISDHPDFLYADDYHEFPCVKKYNNINIIVEIKYATSAISYKYINDFWNNSTEIYIDELSIKTFSVSDTLIHLIAHLYVNSQCEDGYISNKFFRDFVDLKIFLEKYKKIDWCYIFNKTKEYEMIHQVYFALNAINDLWPNTLNNSIINMFELKKINYNCQCNVNGEMLDWKTDIKTRCFNEKLRLKEYCFLYKKNLFSKTNKRDIEHSGICKKVIKKNDIEYLVTVMFNAEYKKLDLLLIYKKDIFEKKKIYFYFSVIDNKASDVLLIRNASNPENIMWNSLIGQWNSHDYAGMGVEQVSIDATALFSVESKDICILIDTYEKIGVAGYRGTGAKERIYISG